MSGTSNMNWASGFDNHDYYARRQVIMWTDLTTSTRKQIWSRWLFQAEVLGCPTDDTMKLIDCLQTVPMDEFTESQFVGWPEIMIFCYLKVFHYFRRCTTTSTDPRQKSRWPPLVRDWTRNRITLSSQSKIAKHFKMSPEMKLNFLLSQGSDGGPRIRRL